MGTCTQLTYHIVFGTKFRRPSITHAIQERLYEYMGGILRERKGHLIESGGVMDHVHLLAGIPASKAVADVVRDIKAGTSKWVNELLEVRDAFEWQKGYAAFSVSYSHIPTVQTYIQGQQEHHRERSFKEEYVEFLKRHNIEFKMEYLFEGEHLG